MSFTIARSASLVVAATLCLATATTAQLYGPEDDVCRVQVVIPGVAPNTNFRYEIDFRASQDWIAALHNRDERLMQQIAGNYYMESQTNIGGVQYLSRQTMSFEGVGSFGFQDQTCVLGPFQSCTPNQGYGRWVAIQNGGGVFTIARNFSDMTRVNACGGFQARLGPDGSLVDPRTGAMIAQRLR